MNWGGLRLVGNVLRLPLAMEGLAAFWKLTFLGLWIFGVDKLNAPGAPGSNTSELFAGSNKKKRQLLWSLLK